MKKATFLLLLILSASARPQPANLKDWTPYCYVLSSAYKTSAEHRDIGDSPQTAWDKDMSLDDHWHYIGKAERKEILNRVYFDESLKSMRGESLSNSVFATCMNNRPKIYKPVE